MLEKTFKFRPICLRNIKISTILLKQGAKSGLNLEQIGKILCRPDDDETQFSLLERIVDKARLITDMMCKMRSKIKDSNLRSIDHNNSKYNGLDIEAIKKHTKKTNSVVGADEEELKFGGSTK